MNRDVDILSRRLQSPSVKDVASLKEVQLIFLILRTFVSKFGYVDPFRGKIWINEWGKFN